MRGRSGLLILSMVVGCVGPKAVFCDDGTVCPADYTCSTMGCLSPGQISACDGKAEDDACTTGTGNGVCHGGACIVAVCGDGILQLPEVCDDSNQLGGDGCNGTCSSDETCGNGIAELGEECDCGDATHPGADICSASVNGGAVCSTTCTARRCGNMIVDPGEVCDDGNDAVGDGCSSYCRSDETCGNGLTDFGAAEQCDDANRRNRDGCGSTCQVEPLLWQQITQTSVPAARRTTMAYDSARGRTVMFGGIGATLYGDTWEIEGTSWIQKFPPLNPPARRFHAMAYDAKRGRVVMFGGENGFAFDDTWEYDGASWTKRTPAASPPARWGHAMAYDAARHVIVMFGGVSATDFTTRLGDTWEYDGTTWTPKTLGTNPSARDGTAMAFDPGRGMMVLFGGRTAFGATSLADTYEYDGTNWFLKTPTAPATARDLHAMTFDPIRNRIVIYGGHRRVALADSTFSDTWEYEGLTWTNVTGAAGSPTNSRQMHAMVFDEKRGKEVMFGGSTFYIPNTTAATDYGDTWEYGGTWLVRTPPAVFTARSLHVLAFDSARGRGVLFGGYTTGYVNDTWEILGNVWTQRTPGLSPSPRALAASAYDSKRGRVVVFGGSNGGAFSETWEYDGSTWIPRTPMTTTPAARVGHAMAYDVGRDRTVMFGGGTSVFNANNETYEWDGNDWALVPVPAADKPPQRIFHTMVYDQSRQRVVLFGGEFSNSAIYDDTYEFDGTTWTKLNLGLRPPGRAEHAMVYDPIRRRSIVNGGKAGVFELEDTWELGPNGWSQFNPTFGTPNPGIRSDAMMAYDSSQQRVLLVAGQRTNNVFNDTWTLGYPQLAAGEACSSKLDYDGDTKVGCADDECWGVCSPLCSPNTPAAQCPMAPRCGDAVCSLVEDCRSCPGDCMVGTGACPIRCGDFFCDTGENLTNCPGDCKP